MMTPEEEQVSQPAQSRGILPWIDARFPLSAMLRHHLTRYYVPKNLNWWYVFGSLALLLMFLQLVTGIVLAMHYKPDAASAFASVEHIMRDVPWGWLVRYMHSTGASMLFVVVYLHMVRGFLYGSYRQPRELVWLFGVGIFFCMMAEAFFGYLLPWGQMSYWGAQVITSMFSTIPVVGPDLALWIRGDYVVSDVTLNRFFALHVIAMPLVLLGLIVVHVMALHEVGSGNPDGIEMRDRLDASGKPVDGIPFHPYYTVHHLFGAVAFMMVFAAIVFFAPEMGGFFLEHNNFLPADAFRSPEHIVPMWYFSPYYAILRATTPSMMIMLMVATVSYVAWLLVYRVHAVRARLVTVVAGALLFVAMGKLDARFWGVVLMAWSVLVLALLPWLDKSPVRSIRYRPGTHKSVYLLFAINFVLLGYLGMQPPTVAGTWMSQAMTLLYFGFFLLMPWWSRCGTFKPVPERVRYRGH